MADAKDEGPKIIEPPEVPRFHKSDIPPQFMHWSWKDYKTRYLPAAQENSLLTYVFGRKQTFEGEATLHPCNQVALNLHRCMDHNRNKFDFCRSTYNIFEGCLREYKV